MLSDAAAWTLDATGLGALLRRLPAWRGLLVLNYHRIAERREGVLDPGLWSATPAQLDEQLTFLTRHFDVVGPEGLLRGRGGGPRVMLTFDDGYRDNHDLALPLLRRHGVPAVFFICSGFIDEPRLPWWDELALLREDAGDAGAGAGAIDEARTGAGLDELAQRLGRRRPACPDDLWMTWDMVRALRDAGMTIGGHTHGHPRLAALDGAGQQRDIAAGLARLREELALERVDLFAYPYGQREDFDAATVAALRREGVTHAFSYYGGHNPGGVGDPYDIRRASVSILLPGARVRAAATLPRLFARW